VEDRGALYQLEQLVTEADIHWRAVNRAMAMVARVSYYSDKNGQAWRELIGILNFSL